MYEQVILNDFDITKVIGENESGVQKFEEGAELTVQLEKDIQEVGIENARIYDVLTTDALGYVKSIKLPYASTYGYRVTQTKTGNDNIEIAPAFNVKIDSSKPPTKHYVVSNQLYTSLLKIEKLLANTGEKKLHIHPRHSKFGIIKQTHITVS